MDISTEQYEVHDLKMVTIHECGHAAVARHYGVPAHPYIWRNKNGDPQEEKLWFGQTQLQAKASDLQMRRICMAGKFAQIFATEYNSPDFGEDNLYAAMIEIDDEDPGSSDENGWSESDWEYAKYWEEADVHAVFMILKNKWESINEEAEELISIAKDKGTAISNRN